MAWAASPRSVMVGVLGQEGRGEGCVEMGRREVRVGVCWWKSGCRVGWKWVVRVRERVWGEEVERARGARSVSWVVVTQYMYGVGRVTGWGWGLEEEEVVVGGLNVMGSRRVMDGIGPSGSRIIDMPLSIADGNVAVKSGERGVLP